MTKQPTGRGLLIAEKASARQEFEAAYNKNRSEFSFQLDFEQFHGHVTQLKMPGDIKPEWKHWDIKNLPMIPDSWDYIPEENPKRYNAVMDKIKNGNYDFIINAGDCEREGQLIQDAFFETMPDKFQSIPIYRSWYNDMSEGVLIKSLHNLLEPDDNIPNAGTVRHLSEASFLRARFDWLLGLNSTQLLSINGKTHIRSGRVKMPIMKVIADRELAIRNFVAKPFWTIKGVFEHSDGTYEGTMLDEEGKPKQFSSEEEAVAVVSSLTDSAVISSVNVKNVEEKAPRFYSVAPLQGDAAELYGITMADSLAALQFLYEQKILSYPRTDSQHITSELATDIKQVYASAVILPQLQEYSVAPSDSEVEKFSKNKYYVNNKEARGHTALMPIPNTKFDYSKLTDTQQKVLYLVSRTVVLAFMDNVKKEKTEILTNVGDVVFKTNGSRMIDEGWSAAVPEYTSTDQNLPKVSEGDAVTIISSDNKKGMTTPPKRYSVKTLLSLLENIHRLLESDEDKLAMKKAEGLGRPATRTSILEDMVTGKMIYTKGKKQEYYATDFGISISENLGDTPLMSPKLTAEWESKLQDVEAGSMSASDLYDQMVDYTKLVISELGKLNLNIENAPDFGDGPVGKFPDGQEVFESKAGFYDTSFREYMGKREEAKSKGEAEPEFYGFWLAKTMDNDTLKMKGSFSKKDVEALIAGKEITKHMIWKKKKSESDINMKLNDQKRLEFVFNNSGKPQEKTKVDIPGFEVLLVTGESNGKPYEFYNINDDFNIWKNVAGFNITEEVLSQLLSGEKVKGTFMSKQNKPFEALLVLKNKKTEFEFINNPKQETIVYDQDGVKIVMIEGKSDTGDYKYYKVNGKFNVYEEMFGHKMTIDEMVLLATSGRFFTTDLVSKKGSSYSAYLVVQGTKIGLEFDN